MQAPEEKPSKSARKRRMHELQRLGGTLLQFSDAQLRRLPLTETLREAVREGKRLKAPAALQRHCQFLGRLLDEADNEALLIAIVTLEQGTQRADPWHHQAERLRDALLAGETVHFQAWLVQLDPADQAQVNAQAERARQAVRRGQEVARESRQLYRLLHRLLEAAASASD